MRYVASVEDHDSLDRRRWPDDARFETEERPLDEDVGGDRERGAHDEVEGKHPERPPARLPRDEEDLLPEIDRVGEPSDELKQTVAEDAARDRPRAEDERGENRLHRQEDRWPEVGELREQSPGEERRHHPYGIRNGEDDRETATRERRAGESQRERAADENGVEAEVGP